MSLFTMMNCYQQLGHIFELIFVLILN